MREHNEQWDALAERIKTSGGDVVSHISRVLKKGKA